MRATKLLLLLALCLGLMLGAPALAEESQDSDPVTPGQEETDPSGEGEDEPEPEPEPAGLSLKPSSSNAKQRGGMWSIPVTSSTKNVKFKWNAVEGAAAYTIELTGTEEPITDSVSGKSWSVAVKKLKKNTAYSVTVRAVDGDGNVLESETITFMIMQTANGGPRGNMPGGDSGSSRITPGKSLDGDHADGTKDMSTYGTVKLDVEQKAMTVLTVGGEQLSVTLDGGESSFVAAVSEDGTELTLSPDADGSSWQLSGRALHTLEISGITALRLNLNGSEVVVSTHMELSGPVYTELRCLGCTDTTFTWVLDASGLHCQANGTTYLYNNGTLTREV